MRTTLIRPITVDRLTDPPGLKPFIKQQSFKDYTHPDDHTRQTTDTPGFKPLTKQQSFKGYSHPDDHTRQTTDTPGLKQFTKQRSLENIRHPTNLLERLLTLTHVLTHVLHDVNDRPMTMTMIGQFSVAIH